MRLKPLLLLSAVWAVLFVPSVRATAQFTDTFNYGAISAPMTQNGWLDASSVYTVSAGNVLVGPTQANFSASPPYKTLLRPTSEDTLAGTVSAVGPAYAGTSGTTGAYNDVIQVVFRWQTSNTSYYYAQLQYNEPTGTGICKIFKVVSGTPTTLGTIGTITPVVGHQYKIEVVFSGTSPISITGNVYDVTAGGAALFTDTIMDSTAVISTTTGQVGVAAGYLNGASTGQTGQGIVTQFNSPGQSVAGTITSNTTTGASIKPQVANVLGGSPPYSVQLQYSTATNGTYSAVGSAVSPVAWNATAVATAAQTGLTASTTYYFRAVVTDALSNVTTLPSASTGTPLATTGAYSITSAQTTSGQTYIDISQAHRINIVGSGTAWTTDTPTLSIQNTTTTVSAGTLTVDTNTTAHFTATANGTAGSFTATMTSSIAGALVSPSVAVSAPSISAISPTSIAISQTAATFTITGINTLFTVDSPTVSINNTTTGTTVDATPAYVYSTDTSMTVNLDTNATPGSFTVTLSNPSVTSPSVTVGAPVAPSASPGSQYTNGTTSVMLTTSSGTMYYTLDGTSPTNASTAYSGAITVPPGATLKSISYVSSTASSVTTNIYYLGAYTPGATYYDTTGTAMCLTSGNMIVSGSTYYWFGQNRLGIATVGGNQAMVPICCYTSTDLLNWTLQPNNIPGSAGILYGRPKVVYNAANNNYVCWAHYDNSSFSLAEVQVWTSPNLTNGGTWTIATAAFQPNSHPSDDIDVFVDTGGTAYLIYANSSTANRIATLNSAYTNVTSTDYSAVTGAQEAQCVILQGGVYFLIMSGQNGYASSENQYWTATSMAGPWTSRGNICNVSGLQNYAIGYNSQSAFLFQMIGTTNWIWFSNIWNSSNLQLTLTSELPVFVSGTSLYTEWLTSWSPSAIFSTTVTAATRRFIH